VPDDPNDLCFMSARRLAALIRERKVSAREAMQAHVARIARVNPRVNAIVGMLPEERCVALADAADRRAARGERLGPLHGLPVAFKDTEAAAGFPFTRGSLIYKDTVAAEDSVLVERLKHAGAIPIGKTNVPEFAMGSHTYNSVYGTTRNPYDLTRSAGGSSGGAAAALATGMLPIADGSDLGGSLRNPASFNNVVALRPSVGLVPTAPADFPFLGLTVKGPLARSVGDVAFLLATLAGPDARDPGSYPFDPAVFTRGLDRTFRGARVAWCLDLGGLPVDSTVLGALEPRRRTFEELGCSVEDACPDFTDADRIFLTLRRWRSASVYGPLLEHHRHVMKQDAIDEIEAGQRLSALEVADAMTTHARFLERFRRFQEQYEFVISVVSQVPPFDASLDWPKAIGQVAMEGYVAWMKSAYWMTVTLGPAASVPAGFTADGLPVGIQIVGRHCDDLGVLQLSHAFEQATGFGARRPPIVSE
jgi:amidase